jgi:DNA-binding transcriptional MerR regulator
MKGEECSELLSGELAARAGVSKDTLRFYERRRLLPPPRRAGNGYRRYPASALGRVRMIRAALSIGFTVDELSSILAVREAGGAPCRQVRKLAGEKLARLGAELAALTRFRADLERVLLDWDGRLKAARGRRAGLLEALAGIDSPLPEDRGHGSRASRDPLPGRKG